MPLLDALDHYIENEDDRPVFMAWAFGSRWEDLTHTRDAFVRWNTLHGHLLELQEGGIIANDLYGMVDLWKRETYKR